MKKFCVFLLIIILCSSFNFAQSKKPFLFWVIPIPHLKVICNLIQIVYGIIPFQDIRLMLSLYVKLGGIN